MKFDPIKDKLLIDQKDLKRVYHLARRALCGLRDIAGKPLDKYKSEGMLDEHDFAAISIMEICETLGIDMGVESSHDFNKIDFRDKD